ncbi:MAG: C40 family peptidase [bacterium]
MAYEIFLKNCNNHKNQFIILISLIVYLIFSIIYFSPGDVSADIIYVTVQPGYTLSQIASKYNTSVSSIMSENGLSNYNIYTGQKLKIVSGGAYVPQQPAVTYGHYVVKFGDTLSLIAQKYNTSISQLKNLNHLYSNVIRQGAVLTVPIYHHPSADIIYVTVQPGYTLSQIATKYNTSVSSIMSENGLSNYNIYAGQKLKVVSGGAYVPQQPAVTYGHYVVKFGDTLSLIAQKYNTSISQLKNLNHLYSNVIRQGAVLTVPIYHHPSADIIYVTVQPGYTLSQIATKYNTSVSSIMSENGLSNYNIYAGQKLKVVSGGAYVPQQPAVTYGHYVVKFGDTLSLIAQKYNTSISKLKNLNHLYSNVIRQGAILTVPESYKVNVYNNSNNSPNSYKNNGYLGKKIVKVAFRYLGVPYVWGGTTRSGMDCSGFVQHVFKKLGITIPRTAREQSRLGKYVPKNKLKPGMLLFFRTYAPYISHVGIYIGHGKFIQANSGAGKITVNSLSNEYFKRTYAFAKSIK